MFRSSCNRILSLTKRAFATEAKATTPVSEKLLLTFASPSQTIMKNTVVEQVNLVASTGSLGILSKHIPSVFQLKPSVIEIVESPSKSQRFFVSGGYAVMNPDNTLNITSIEVFPLDQFDEATARKNLEKSRQNLLSVAKNDFEKAICEVEIEVGEALLQALTTAKK